MCHTNLSISLFQQKFKTTYHIRATTIAPQLECNLFLKSKPDAPFDCLKRPFVNRNRNY